MRRISDTIERLARYTSPASSAASQVSKLAQLEIMGPNPGKLLGWFRKPDAVKHPALVVVLHGCTQTAAGYDNGSGWSQLAEDYGFAVLFPEQTRQNNPNLCFNWFQTEDITRGAGEVRSIREMVATMVGTHGVDAQRVYVTGLSAGGAMTNALLATYPEVFAGGAIIAGLPYATAATVPEAFDRMRGHGLPSPVVLQNKIREATRHDGAWPTVAVWQGTADKTVVRANARAIIDQWQGVHGVAGEPTVSHVVEGQAYEAWTDGFGRAVIEHYQISGMNHGTPLDGTTGYGRAAPYRLDVGISSTVHIARSWGLTPSFERKFASNMEAHAASSSAHLHSPSGTEGIQEVIERAMRSAGLMK
jgi:poly(hydroxyalkanoate) depolymerase family esterase